MPAERTPFLSGSFPVRAAAQTASADVGWMVARRITAPESRTRPKFGSLPSAVARTMKSSDPASIAMTFTREPRPGSVKSVAISSDRASSGWTLPGPRSATGTAIDEPAISSSATCAEPAGLAAERASHPRQQHERDGCEGERPRASRHRHHRVGVEDAGEGVEIGPHQRRARRRRQRAEPDQHADAEPCGREHFARGQLPHHEQHVTDDREVHGVKQPHRRHERREPGRIERQRGIELQHHDEHVGRRQPAGGDRVAQHPQVAHFARSILPRCRSTSPPK